MEGSSSSPGVTVRAVRYLFAAAAKLAAAIAAAGSSGGSRGAPASSPSFSFAVSMMEVHNERVRDLLAGSGPAQLALAQAEVEAAAAAMDGVDTALDDGSRAAAAAAPPDAAWAGSLGSAAAARAAADVDPDNLHVRDGGSGGVEVVGLTRLPVASAAAALAVARVGAARRAVGGHALNEASSRSHMIVRLWLVGPSAAASGASSSSGGGSGFAPTHRQTVSACLNFVDLAGECVDGERGRRCSIASPSPAPLLCAGSERIRRTGVEGERLREAQAINSSLSSLGNVIAGLKRHAPHVPYRDSRLTFLLKDALGPGGAVLMFACVSAEAEDVSETLATLGFAERCRATALGGGGGGSRGAGSSGTAGPQPGVGGAAAGATSASAPQLAPAPGVRPHSATASSAGAASPRGAGVTSSGSAGTGSVSRAVAVPGSGRGASVGAVPRRPGAGAASLSTTGMTASARRL